MMIKQMVVVAIALLCACSQRESVNNESVVISKCMQVTKNNAAKLAGCVEAQFDIDSDGVPHNIKITQFLLDRVDTDQLIKSISKWRYEKDKPRIGMTITIVFGEQINRQ